MILVTLGAAAVLVLLAAIGASWWLGRDDRRAREAPGVVEESSPPPAADSPTSTPPRPVGAHVGDLAPDLELRDLEGNTVRLGDYRGQVVMITFWATWCRYCRAQMPDMEAVYQDYRERGVVILAVNVKEDKDTVREYIKSQGLSFPVLMDTRGRVDASYQIRGYPSSFFLDREGVIRSLSSGGIDRAKMVSEIEQLL